MKKNAWRLGFLVVCFMLLIFQAVNAAEPIKLSLMHILTEADKSQGNVIAYREMMEKFKASHPDIKITEEAIDQDTYGPKIKTLAAGNELPDVFLIKGSWVSSFVNNKLIEPMNADLDRDPAYKKGFLPGAFDDFRIGNNIYGAPFQLLITSLVFYNKDIFEKCGIKSFPATWDEFKSAILKLKKNGYIPIALGNKGNWVAESCILSTLGDRFTGTDWFLKIRDKKGAKFTDPNFVKALKEMQDLAKSGAFNTDLNSLDNGQQRTLYYNGKAAMFFEGSWAVSSVSTDAPKAIAANTRLAVIPVVKGGKGEAMTASAGTAWAWNVSANLKGEKRKAAIALIKAVTGPDYAKICLENNFTPPYTVKNVDKSKLLPLFSEYSNLVPKVKLVPIYDIQLAPAVIEVMNTGLQDLLINATTPGELAQKIQKEYERAN